MTAEPVRVGIIGLGFMGQTHARAYQRAAIEGHRCRIVAVADRDVERRAGRVAAGGNIDTGDGPLFDPAALSAYAEPQALLDDDRIELVSICTYTDTHVPLALAALEAGKHVLVEKPVATSAAAAQQLADAAASSPTRCMAAMCMRFWPGWSWLAERIASGDLGELRTLTLHRLGSRPTWSRGFYEDARRCGGAIFDLHIHDADFIAWALGPPRAVFAAGDSEHVAATYLYGDGPLVTAEGGWKHAPAYGFSMRYLANFERGTADFDIAREHPLILHAGGSSEAIALPDLSGYDLEIRHALALVRDPRLAPIAPCADAPAVTRLLEVELQSQREGRVVELAG